MTNVDKALLLAEWSCEQGSEEIGPTIKTCPVCGLPDIHGIDCAMDLALSERGYCTQPERNRARGFINVATAPTLPPAKP
jgi:hypothetical protein